MEWKDEKLGYGVGKKEYIEGVETYSYIPKERSQKAMEMVAEINNVDLKDMGYIYSKFTNKYEYHAPKGTICQS